MEGVASMAAFRPPRSHARRLSAMALAALVFTLVVVILGYRFYAVRVDRDILQADPNRATPAQMYKDGVDFMPASSSVLFGYQFKSIAALGPIVGPITAAQFGWLPAILWLVLGVFFIGWVQDYASSMLAMRNEGMTMGGLSYKLIWPRARTLLLSFLYIYLLLIMGAFGAIFTRPLGYGDMTWANLFWAVVMLGFCYLGSVLPIWRFAQPVNYTSFWFVFLGIIGSAG